MLVYGETSYDISEIKIGMTREEVKKIFPQMYFREAYGKLGVVQYYIAMHDMPSDNRLEVKLTRDDLGKKVFYAYKKSSRSDYGMTSEQFKSALIENYGKYEGLRGRGMNGRDGERMTWKQDASGVSLRVDTSSKSPIYTIEISSESLESRNKANYESELLKVIEKVKDNAF
jgi:hypothetical protein